MKHRPFAKLSHSSDTHKISQILRNMEVHYHTNKRRKSVFILSHINRIPVPSSYFLKINFNIIIQSKTRSSKLPLFFKFSHNIPFVLWLFFMRVTSPVLLILQQFMFLITSGRSSIRSCSPSLYHFLKKPVTVSLLWPNIKLFWMLLFF
jgi:hypothetical protein